MISVVVPVYNEKENVGLLYEKIKDVMIKNGYDHEIIFVDDGSNDGTFEELKKITDKDKQFKVIRFRRNFGQTAAMAAGFDYAHGEIIVSMDGDLQNDPEDIPKLIEKLDKGYDVVSGWRKNRQDEPKRVFLSKVANKLISKITKVELHDYGCSLKAYRSCVAKNLHMYGEMHRFIPALANIYGASITEVEVNHHPRKFGRSKYNLSRTFRVIVDLILVYFMQKFMTRPIHFFGIAGFFMFFLGFLIDGYLAVQKIFFGVSLSNRPLLLLGVLLILTGINLVGIGIISEILTRIYYESQNKKIYNIRTILNDDNEKSA
ncbi:glycosyltransferase family 2 protein [Hippea maritima]|uniref:Glycosyl transferase family 2 n=1 Tax=Hippea maritima (strain ATCC 700847 / DSM 10411 / MH2) TaxID=760142 RepID=F2LXZ1_HIPMA|nr:glycosyltransferase family 2 protein [Hippea maritima]AEA33256.1 glycosyl transferase family 2 [Hippea maritima DSM 10411]